MILLTDEEIELALKEAIPFYKPYTVNEWEVIKKAQLKKVVKDIKYRSIKGNGDGYVYAEWTADEWQALLEGIK